MAKFIVIRVNQEYDDVTGLEYVKTCSSYEEAFLFIEDLVVQSRRHFKQGIKFNFGSIHNLHIMEVPE